MYKDNASLRILMENMSTFKERNELVSLLENDSMGVNNAMVTNLYKSAIDKSHIDFGKIPDSKGDITKYAGYKSTMTCISILRDLSVKGGVTIPELDIVDKSIQAIIKHRDLFEKGFRMHKEFIIMQYNTLVYAVVESVSSIISSYVDYVKRPDKVEFTLIAGPQRPGQLMIQSLNQFITASRQGEFARVLNGVLSAGKDNFIGGSAIAAAAIIGGIASIVPITREIIFLGYYSRMKISDYLEQQAALIDINRQNANSFVGSPKEKQEIANKQAAYAEKLRRLSEKIKVDRASTEREASVNMRAENKTFTLNGVSSQMATNANNGFQLI